MSSCLPWPFSLPAQQTGLKLPGNKISQWKCPSSLHRSAITAHPLPSLFLAVVCLWMVNCNLQAYRDDSCFPLLGILKGNKLPNSLPSSVCTSSPYSWDAVPTSCFWSLQLVDPPVQWQDAGWSCVVLPKFRCVQDAWLKDDQSVTFSITDGSKTHRFMLWWIWLCLLLMQLLQNANQKF